MPVQWDVLCVSVVTVGGRLSLLFACSCKTPGILTWNRCNCKTTLSRRLHRKAAPSLLVRTCWKEHLLFSTKQAGVITQGLAVVSAPTSRTVSIHCMWRWMWMVMIFTGVDVITQFLNLVTLFFCFFFF